ncbi:DUF2157 domain-containing protein [Hymenobacter jeollabukensis]|uniref:DUF2157 domain-containing protein n=1 Tax=Hymenobacter jeollabukensis TaxID=2025313 RepID=A0A5R8WUP4_9BACT|nr:DUF2157 domain-containing protein [Hymenobacter jeollabukensis]TLM95480.1 DUF2157 domain-containing protein [Hymenobacter jeollabukensis]
MSPESVLRALLDQQLLPPEQAALIRTDEAQRPFSLHHELRLLLYVGIVLLSGGLGVLIYQHLDDIGHGVVVAAIALLMLLSLGYAARHRQPFSWGEAAKAGFLPDYALLLGCLLFVTLETYLQVQYGLFGTRYGLATLLPALVFLPLAYRFDHRGVLAMGITALAAWVGVTIQPLSAFTTNDFWHSRLSTAAMLLGLGLMLAGLLSERYGRKAHFAFTYISLGSNLLLIAATVTLLDFTPGYGSFPPVLLVPLILLVCAALVWYARRTHSYLLLLMGVGYAYMAVTYTLVRFIAATDSGEAGFTLLLLYVPLSAAGVVWLFLNIKKILRLR